jgi:porphyrinogen peroxidase
MIILANALNDIPALVGSGFSGLRQGRYFLARIGDAALARRWLADVIRAGLVKGLADVRAMEGGDAPAPARTPLADKPGESVTLAISHAGLHALGLRDDPARPFPSAFRAGMADPIRRRLIGDDTRPLEPWEWGDAATGGAFVTHLLIAHYWADQGTPSTLLGAATLAEAGLETRIVESWPGAMRPDPQGRMAMYEPFGFQDGAGQPRLRGIATPSRAEPHSRQRPIRTSEDRNVHAGEFVLGHRNEYDEKSYAPSVVGWPAADAVPPHFGSNGSYLVAMQIQQYVDVFKRFIADAGVADLDAKMVGRQINARPMVDEPLRGADTDDFRYLASDAPGFECPRGAHIRRANPRDALAHTVEEGIQSLRLHRLLRRGRVYAETPSQGAVGDGLMFLALNADLDRQFEFVHRNWVMGARFGDLSDEQDPILGTREGRTFTLPGCPVGQRVGPLPRFTRMRGGGYFFLPGLSALRFIAGLADRA